MSDLPAIRGGLARRHEQLPSELAEAVLDAANRIAAALPPGVQLDLRFEDSSDLAFREADISKALVTQQPVKAETIPGRLDVLLHVEGREGYFHDLFTGTVELHAHADARLLDRDADGRFDQIALLHVTVDHSRAW